MRNQTKKVQSDRESDDERNPSWHQTFECSLFGTMKPEEEEEDEEEEDNSVEPETEVDRRGREDESHEESCHKMALITPLRLMMLKRERRRRRRGKNRSQIKDENGNTAEQRGEYRDDQNRKMDGVEVSDGEDDDDTEIGIWLSPGTDFSDRDDRKFGRYLQGCQKYFGMIPLRLSRFFYARTESRGDETIKKFEWRQSSDPRKPYFFSLSVFPQCRKLR